MTSPLELSQRYGWNDDYWLMRCKGFAVEYPDARLGVVAETHFRSRLDRPDELVIRSGLLGQRTTVVPTSEVAQILPAEGRIMLQDRRTSQPHELATRLRTLLAATFGSN